MSLVCPSPIVRAAGCSGEASKAHRIDSTADSAKWPTAPASDLEAATCNSTSRAFRKLRSSIRRFAPKTTAHRPARGDRLGRLQRRPQGADHAQGRPRLRRSRLRPLGRVDRDQGAPRAGAEGLGRSEDEDARARDLRLAAQRRHLPGRDLEDLSPRRGSCSEELDEAQVEVDLLDLSLLTSDYGRTIHPCKGCVSTAMPLCHWPCSCYPNHCAQPGQRLDERDLRALGRGARVVIVTPTHWYQTSERAQADDRPAGLRRRRQSRPDLDPRQEARARPRSSSSRAGTIRSTSPAASTAWWCTATSPASRARGARSPTGSTGWA